MADVVYAFMTFNLTLLSKDGQAVELGYGSGVDKGGVKFTLREEDQGIIETGSDGFILNSLTSSRLGSFKVQLQKNSRQNSVLMNMFNLQKGSPSLWGQNTIQGADSLRGDVITGDTISFTRPPEPVYAEKAEMMEWTFKGNLEAVLGSGPST